MDIKNLTGKGAAQEMYKAGEGLNANPFPRGSEKHDQYNIEMHWLQLDELKNMAFGG